MFFIGRSFVRFYHAFGLAVAFRASSFGGGGLTRAAMIARSLAGTCGTVVSV